MTNFHTHKLYSVWDQVDVRYYQDGVRQNLLQRVWHGIKITTATSILKSRRINRLLDVGCASGYMLSCLAAGLPQAKLYGVDVYDKAIAYAKKAYPEIRFKVAEASRLPYADGYFDTIICYEVIEHVENPRAVLKELRRVMAPGGRLLLAMDSGNWMFRIVWYVWEKTFGRAWQNAHLHPFHHSQLEALVRKSGLKIVDKHFTHWGMEVVFVLTK